MKDILKQEELIEGLRLNDRKTIEVIYGSCFPLVRYFILKNNGNIFNAEDIFQEAVLVLYQKLQTDFVLTCNVNTYIVQISKRLWLKYLYQNKNKTAFVLEQYEHNYATSGEDDDDIREKMELDLKIENLNIALEKLGTPCNEILKAFYNENKSMQEISLLFGYTNENNAKVQKYKCLMRLKKIFFQQ